MSSLTFFEWLTNSPWANFMNGPEWAFPIVESLHFIGLALSIGTIAIIDFRLLGIGMGRQSASELAADLAPWTRAGIGVMFVTGLLMFSADAVNYHTNAAFQFKMTCLLLALLFHFTIHRRVAMSQGSPIVAKLAGACPWRYGRRLWAVAE